MPDWVHQRLHKQAAWVVTVLEELTTATRVGPDKVKIPAMPKSAVRHTQGLAIMKKIKRGCVLSMTQEHAFVINKVVGDDGNIRWSAPVFMRGSAYGVGLTFGYMTTWTCLALMNDKSLESATTKRGDWGFNWNFLLDMDASRIKKVSIDSAAADSQVVTDRFGGMLAKYYIVDAALLDLSMRGGRVRPNKKLNMAVYGPNVNTQDILAGKVLPPVEFQPVYDLLNSFISETAPAPKVERRGSRHGGRGLDDIEASGASGVRMYANQHAGIY